jgi:hypothetical protein
MWFSVINPLVEEQGETEGDEVSVEDIDSLLPQSRRKEEIFLGKRI